jgi:phosphate transport system substrate-binding protein
MKLKKTLTVTLACVMLLAIACPINASAAPVIKLYIDGVLKTPAAAPYVESGTTFVPVRFITENLGAEVSWDGPKQQAIVESAGAKIVFTIGSRTYTVNGASKTLTAAPKLVRSGGATSTMIPIRAIAEGMGATVDYDGSAYAAYVNYFSTMTGTLKITGSTTLQPIAQAAADQLNALNGNKVSVSVAGGGSGTGINDCIAGTNNLGMSSRELTADEASKISGFDVARDGIAIIVHPSNKVTNLTAQQAADIFLGKIKNWNEVGGDDAPILVHTRETGSGTRATLEEMLLEKESVVGTATPFASSTLIKQAVAKEKNAVGFDSIGFVDSTVKAVSLDGTTATAASVKSGTYIMGRSLLIVCKERPAGNAAKFIDYLRTEDCQKNIVEKEGYIAK